LIDTNFDKNYSYPLIGVDEVGRGSWAGPVMAGAAMLDLEKPLHKKLNDSKKLSPEIRNEILVYLEPTTLFGIGEASNFEIDQKGILQATFLAMERAIKSLIKKLYKKNISTILIDGINMPDFQNKLDAKIKLVKGGDGKSPSIASASIYAKQTRDKLMKKMDKTYPGYGFSSNMGYGTKFHRKNLIKLGPTPLHRMTFKPLRNFEENSKY